MLVTAVCREEALVNDLFSIKRRTILQGLKSDDRQQLSTHDLEMTKDVSQSDALWDEFYTTAPRVIKPRKYAYPVLYRCIYLPVKHHEEPLYIVCSHPELPEVGSGLFLARDIKARQYMGTFFTTSRTSQEELDMAPDKADYVLKCDHEMSWERGWHPHTGNQEWFNAHPYLLFPSSIEACHATPNASLHVMNDYGGLAPGPNVYLDRDGQCWAMRDISRLEEAVFFYGDSKMKARLTFLGKKKWLFHSIHQAHAASEGISGDWMNNDHEVEPMEEED